MVNLNVNGNSVTCNEEKKGLFIYKRIFMLGFIR